MAFLDAREQYLFKYIVSVLGPMFTFFFVMGYYLHFYDNFLTFVGGAFSMIGAAKIIQRIRRRYTKPPRDPASFGKWAVITGATAGIGQAYAHELAGRGMNVLIISRTESKLQKEKESLLEKYPGIEVDYLAYDFSDRQGSNNFYESLANKIRGMEGGIGVLINNVGIANPLPAYMHELDDATTYDILYVNIEGTVRVTRTVLPFMVERKKGAIINISSGSGNHPTPLLTMYASTKAFINEFSQSLSHEVKDFGDIEVMVVTPYYVSTNMYKKKPNVLSCSAERMVTDSLSLLGLERIAYPYRFHELLGFLFWVYWRTPQALMENMKATKERAAAPRSKPAKEAAGSSPVTRGKEVKIA